MGGQRTVIIFRPSEQLDGRNWFLMVAPSIVLAISKFAYRQSNEEQDMQNEFMGKIQQFRGPLIQTPLRLRLMNQTRNMKNRRQMMPHLCICPYLSFFIIDFLVVSFLIPFLFPLISYFILASFIFIDVFLYFGESIKFQFLSYSLFTFSTSPIYICFFISFFVIFTMNS